MIHPSHPSRLSRSLPTVDVAPSRRARAAPLKVLLLVVVMATLIGADHDARGEEAQAHRAEVDLLHAPDPAAPPAPPRAPRRSDDPRADPSVEELCRAAVAMAMAEPERARSFLGRARLAGWLPEFRFRIFRRFARTEGLTLDDTATTTPVDVSAVDDVRYEWRATWDLSRMVFNPDELQAHAEALRMADVRRDIQSLVVRLYFERRRLLLIGGRGGTDEHGGDVTADERRRLAVLEIEAQLEALAGRAFFGTDGGRATEASP